MRIKISFLLTAITAALPSLAAAQQRPAIRQLGAVVAKTADAMPSISGIRSLGDGHVLVNDVTGRRVLLFDDLLKTSILVADSTSATANAYGGRFGGLIPYRGDSSLFVDPSSSSMLVIDPAGKIGRVISVPRSEDAFLLANTQFGIPGFDAQGRLVYRAMPGIRRPGIGPNGTFTAPVIPDSAPVLRVDLATRKVDTVGFTRTPKIKMDIVQNENGGIRMTMQVNPLPTIDEWAVIADGSVAILRGSDYHVDWFNADGTKSSSPKIPFDWQRLTDDDKVAFIDSVKAARARMLASQPATGGGTGFIGGGGGAGGGGGGGGPQIAIVGGGGGGGGERRILGPGGPGGPTVNFVTPSELPDYKPVFFAGAMRPDRDGNIWIRTIPTKKIEGGPVYDVVNRKGELIDRVQVPLNTTIAGFGPDGSVFLSLQSNNTVYLEKARIR